MEKLKYFNSLVKKVEKAKLIRKDVSFYFLLIKEINKIFNFSTDTINYYYL